MVPIILSPVSEPQTWIGDFLNNYSSKFFDVLVKWITLKAASFLQVKSLTEALIKVSHLKVADIFSFAI